MGIVWEAYHKGFPLLGVPENPIDLKHAGQIGSRESHHLRPRKLRFFNLQNGSLEKELPNLQTIIFKFHVTFR